MRMLLGASRSLSNKKNLMCSDMVGHEDATLDGMSVPIGWRFMPTDEELIVSYLSNKVALRSLPAKIIKEIDASEFYSKHPRDLVDQNIYMEGDRCFQSERYFFIHRDKYFHGEVEKRQPVGDIGFWRFAGKEEPIYDADGNIFAWKIQSTFFSANPKIRRTDWKMEEYRLTITADIGHEEELRREEWVAARIRKGI